MLCTFFTNFIPMGLDLTLIAISNKANFIIDKARQNNYYAADIDKLYNTNTLKHHLKMVQAKPGDKAFEASLKELIKDSEFLTTFYPNGKYENYVFSSETRGYDTINYLLQQSLQNDHRQKSFNRNTFYGGIDIDFAKQHTRLEYIDHIKVSELSDFLNSFKFEALLSHYNYDRMINTVYKLIGADDLEGLEVEFKKLQTFYLSAKALDAFMIAKVS